MEQRYPFIIFVFKDDRRFLINPDLVTSGEFRSNSPWIKIISNDEKNKEALIGNAVSEAVEYIKHSPVMDIMETINQIGEFVYWKHENKYRSLNEFEKKNVCCCVTVNEDNTYEISPQTAIDGDLYYDIKQMSDMIKNASPAEIGSAIVNITAMQENHRGINKKNSYPPEEIGLLCGGKIKIYPPRNSHFSDCGDGGAAEIYKLYEYSASENAGTTARFFIGIAAELDCNINEDNIRAVWERLYGKADSFDVTRVSHGIFTLRADMRNKNIRRVSYLLQINENELLECSAEIEEPNKRKKTEEKLLIMFEEFASVHDIMST